MKILFVLCEGPHDAQFVGRLLHESDQYELYNQKLKNYPSPLGDFFAAKFQNRTVQELRIGKPDFPQVPLCAFKSKQNGGLVFPISLGGMDKYQDAIKLITEIEEALAADTLSVTNSDIHGYSLLFLYDADSRGKEGTIDLFINRFNKHYSSINNEVGRSWVNLREHLLSVFVFTDSSGETGVLEDALLDLFRLNAAAHVGDTENHFGTYFEACAEEGDKIAHEAKKKKGILTTCGQMEMQNAGAALTVVIRDTSLLNNAFDFTDKSTQWYMLLQHINTGLNPP